MKLSKKALEEFKKNYKAEFGEDLSDSEAEEQALRVLRVFELIFGPTNDKKQIAES